MAKPTPKKTDYSLKRGKTSAALSFVKRYNMGTKAGPGSSRKTKIKQAALNAKSRAKQTAKQLAAARKNIRKAIAARWK